MDDNVGSLLWQNKDKFWTKMQITHSCRVILIVIKQSCLLFRQILKLLKPKESVAKALRRIGGNKKPLSSAERWKRKKAGITEDPEEKSAKEAMLKLTGLADTILTRSGNMEVIYLVFHH